MTDIRPDGPVAAHRDGAVLSVVVTPRSGRTGFDRIEGDAVRVKLAAPPVDGAANTALIKFLADRLDLPRSAITMLSGETSRRKRLLLRGIAPDEVRAALPPGG